MTAHLFVFIQVKNIHKKQYNFHISNNVLTCLLLGDDTSFTSATPMSKSFPPLGSSNKYVFHPPPDQTEVKM